MGAGPLRQRSRRRVAGRTLLVGDAGGYVDALTGEGIALGLAHARAAVACAVADDPARFEAMARGSAVATSCSPTPCSARPRTGRCAGTWCRPRPAPPGSSPPPSTSSPDRSRCPHDVRPPVPGRVGGPARRGGPRHRHRGQARRAPHGHAPAPGVLLLPLRRRRAPSWSPSGPCTSPPGRGCGPTAAAATRRPARTWRRPYAVASGRSSACASRGCGCCCRASATAR